MTLRPESVSLPTSPSEAGIGTVAGGDGGTHPPSSSPAARPSCWRCGRTDLHLEGSALRDDGARVSIYHCRNRSCDRRTSIVTPKEED